MQKTKQFLFKKEGRKATYKIYLGVIFSLTFLFLFSLSLTSAMPEPIIHETNYIQRTLLVEIKDID
jgi:hypothetical protein